MYTLDEIREAIRQLPVDQRWKIEDCLRELDDSPLEGSRVREAVPAYATLDSYFMTLEEFFEFDEKSPLRHEFINGLVFAMAVPSLNHRVVVYPRAERWTPRVYAGLDTAVELRSIDLTVPLIELYADVTSP